MNTSSQQPNHLAVTTAKVRAVDVGYFNTKITLGRNESAGLIETQIFPSMTTRFNGTLLDSPGMSALDIYIVDVGESKTRFAVGKDVGFVMTGKEKRLTSEHYCTSMEYSALFKGALHEIAKAEGYPPLLIIEKLVLGLPLNTYQTFHNKLVANAKGFHSLKTKDGKDCLVKVIDVHVIVQPQGALINCSMKLNQPIQGWQLVLDPGGGTLDWFLTKGNVPSWSRSGAYPKSMLSCSTDVARKLNPKWQHQPEIIEIIDKAICDHAASFKIGPDIFSTNNIWNTVDAAFEEPFNAMLESIGETDVIEKILVTGGAGKVLHRHMLKFHPELARKVVMDDDPVFSNVRGFHMIGEMFASHAGVQNATAIA